MNKDFLKPAIIFALAAVLTGLLAILLPAYSNDLFPIRKMSWFSALSKPTAADTTHVLVPVVRRKQLALKPFLDKLKAMPTLTGKAPLIVAEEDSLSPISAPRQLRIAYYSDSIIEGDLITGPLRYALQDRYGGHGVGMMPITSIVSGFRQTIRHTFSKNWESISFTNPGTSGISLGITGYTFIPRPYYLEPRPIDEPLEDSFFEADSLLNTHALADSLTQDDGMIRHYVDEDPWVEYRAVNIAGGADSFRQIRLFYSHASDSSMVHVSQDGGDEINHTLSAGNSLKILDLSPEESVRRIKLTFAADDPIRIYGVSFDDEEGIYVDNYPLRGYSGMYFQRIYSYLLGQFNRALSYDLIVLQYGGNITHPDNTEYENYKVAMTRTIEHLQSAMPGVPILIASMHDRAVKIGTEFKSSPDLPYLIAAQSEVAEATGCAFWNVYEAMGGYNSMIGFVNQNPPLAGTDYTHFTRRGADRIAKLFLDFIKEES